MQRIAGLAQHLKDVQLWGRNGVAQNYTRRSISLQLPEKYKGTIIEKWYMYWKNLFQDYAEVGRDTVKEIKLKPIKALTIVGGLGFATYCVKNNPDESNFRDTVLNYANDVSLVAECTRNEHSVAHLKHLEQCYNSGLTRRMSLGLFSIIWLDNYEKDCALYEARCSYVKPAYKTFYTRIVDVGFLNRWWLIEKEMKNYDVNFKEWSKEN